MGSRWQTGSASRGLDRFAGIVSCGRGGPSSAGSKVRMQSTALVACAAVRIGAVVLAQ
jgi:hypothetical protein